MRLANRAFLNGRRELAHPIVSGRGGLEVAESLRVLTDRWIVALWQQAIPAQMSDGISLFATGGYGRRELALHSDVDLLVAVHDDDLANDERFELAIERLMAWSRQTRVSLSHAVRTAEQTRHAIVEDRRTPIALLDSRHLSGPKTEGDVFDVDFIVDHLRGDDQGITFVAGLVEGLRHRAARHGKTVFLLEPDLKNGEGGLRDINYIAWAARVRWRLDVRRDIDEQRGWSESHRQDYRQGLDALLSMRNRLHLLRERKQDRLTFREQEALARLIEYGPVSDVDQALAAVDQARKAAEAQATTQDEALHDAIEDAMGRHYRRARKVATTCERVLRHWCTEKDSAPTRHGPFEVRRELLSLADEQGWSDQAVFDALELAGQGDRLLDPRLETRIEEQVRSWPTGDDAPELLTRRLRDLLVDSDIGERTSRRLLELGILTRMVPEFEPLVCHVQHDLYHVFTTDVHSIKCLEEGRALLSTAPEDHRWPVFAHVAADIDDPTVFLLACLFHDIGKNRGGGHSEKGARMMEDVGPRLGLSPTQVERLSFLVRHHLALSNTSRRRDISDPEILEEMAQLIGSPKGLAELTALTYCDMATVGPEVLNDWSASLLIELYRRLREVLGPSEVVSAQQSQAPYRRRLTRAIEAHFDLDGKYCEDFVDDLPPAHLSTSTVAELLRQYDAYCQAMDSDDKLAITCVALPDRGVTELIVSSSDRPGTLSRIAGAIASVGVNIMAANIVTTNSGRTLDIFHVAHFNPRAVPPERPRPVDGERRLERLRERVADALLDRIDVDETLRRRLDEQRLAPRPVPAVPTEVCVDDEASSRFTVLEVRAPDRLGLLYSIAQTLLENQVNTKISRVDSLGSQAIDVFYVEEMDGTPLSEERTDQVVQALLTQLIDDGPSQ